MRAVERRVDLCHIEARCVTRKVAVACAKQMGVLRWDRPARAADAHRRCSARAHRRTEESGRARPAISLGDATGAKRLAQARSRGAPGASNRTRSSCRVPSPSSSRTASTNAYRPAVQPRKHPRGSIRATRNEAHWNGVDALPSDGGNGSIRRMDPTCGGPWADGRARGVFRVRHADHSTSILPLRKSLCHFFAQEQAMRLGHCCWNRILSHGNF